MATQILLSIDLEDHTGRYNANSRYIANTRILTDYLNRHGLRATFFTVGRVAEHVPQLVQEIARAGHEIACHSYDHTPLTMQTADAFKNHTGRAKDILEQVISKHIDGYRAPIFSLTAQTPWAAGILKELGFSYSSSVLPGKHPLYGFANIPQIPFYWPGGLLEFPAVLGNMGIMQLPFLGGIYLRYLPAWLIKKFLGRVPADAQAWTYIHPYDIDPSDPDWRMEKTAAWVSLLLWFNRKNTFKKLDLLLPHFSPLTFQEAVIKHNEAGGNSR